MTFLRKHQITAFLTLIILTVFFAGMAHGASNYPNKPITVVVCFAPGGDSDISARLWAEYAEKKLGQPVLVINKVGGGGVTGTSFAAAAKPDGYTLFLVNAGPVMITPNLAKTSYSFDSFEYISRINIGNCGLVVKADAPWKDLTEFIADAKANPNKYSFASPSATTWLSFAMRQLMAETGTKMKIVEFQGGAPVVTSLLGGHTTYSFLFPQNYLTQVKAGQLRLLAIGEHNDEFPDVKTFNEQGFSGGFTAWAGIAAPKGVDPAIIAKLEAVTAEIVSDPGFIEKSLNIGVTPLFKGNKEWAPELKRQYDSLVRIIKQ